jgi:hypothetical protein
MQATGDRRLSEGDAPQAQPAKYAQGQRFCNDNRKASSTTATKRSAKSEAQPYSNTPVSTPTHANNGEQTRTLPETKARFCR